ncbi:MAG TPA: ATP-binding protein [Acetobacteraceae bacterium]|nr:ATP-binding protein [Acetobacteraceae bacterium]
MASIRELHVFRSASVRLAALYALVFGASALVLIAFIWWATAGLLDRQVDVAIRADAQGLLEQWSTDGLPGLMARIHERLFTNFDDDAIYLLADPLGNIVTGNLQTWPPQVQSDSMWYELPVQRAGVHSLARVHVYDLPDGFRLLVGRDVRSRAQLRSLLTDALFWALLIVVALGVLGSLLVRSLFHRMIANVSATAAAISAGDLTRRVRVTGRGDEFDRLAETINDMLDRIARLMDGVRQVSNAIAHDLRTPITRARARLEDVGANATREEELRAGVERAIADLDGVVAVFQALLRIAEIEAGARRSAFSDIDLGPPLSDLAELYGAVAEEKGLRLCLTMPEHLRAYGDRELIQQAAANLLDNAVKFSPPGTTATLEAAAEPPFVRITVCDEGPGIPAADRARATERFFRGEQARHTPGAGLGLALVQAVATLHGGELRLADRNPGLSATFTLAAQPPSARAPQAAAEPAA